MQWCLGLARGECSRVFEAEVFSGLGEGEFYVSIYSKGFRLNLGFTPYPGTLNTRLRRDVELFNKCLELSYKIIVEPPKIEGIRLAPVEVYPAYIDGYPSWIVRPQITVYKRDVVELIADVNLRELLSIQDGDIVEIELKDP